MKITYGRNAVLLSDKTKPSQAEIRALNICSGKELPPKKPEYELTEFSTSMWESRDVWTPIYLDVAKVYLERHTPTKPTNFSPFAWFKYAKLWLARRRDRAQANEIIKFYTK